MKKYTAEDIIFAYGHEITSDEKYILRPDGTGYYYWHKVNKIENDDVYYGMSMGHISYDYCFKDNHAGSADRLNRILAKTQLWRNK